MDKHLYIYVVVRDCGFAPNPFHGYCTLATCKPRIRNSAKIGDWILGVGGGRLKATGKCIFLMKVTEIQTFNEYWSDARFQVKKSVRNGSLVMMAGDNIYHQENDNASWTQEDSHHSMTDGTQNIVNLKRDTSSGKVLISEHFYYFGKNAPLVDLDLVEYKNRIDHDKRQFEGTNMAAFIDEFELRYSKDRNRVLANPFDFSSASKRVDQATGKIT